MPMAGKFIIRDYKKGDYPGVCRLWEVTGLGDEKRGDDESIILSSISLGGAFLVMEEIAAKQICGTSWMTFDGRRIHLHHFGILPEYQGKGLAGRLMRKTMDFIREKGFQAKLEVHPSNLKAVSLYKKSGFEYLGDYDVYIIRNLSKI